MISDSHLNLVFGSDLYIWIFLKYWEGLLIYGQFSNFIYLYISVNKNRKINIYKQSTFKKNDVLLIGIMLPSKLPCFEFVVQCSLFVLIFICIH